MQLQVAPRLDVAEQLHAAAAGAAGGGSGTLQLPSAAATTAAVNAVAASNGRHTYICFSIPRPEGMCSVDGPTNNAQSHQKLVASLALCTWGVGGQESEIAKSSTIDVQSSSSCARMEENMETKNDGDQRKESMLVALPRYSFVPSKRVWVR